MTTIFPVTVSFRDMTSSVAVEEYARSKAGRLARFCGEIQHCRVLIEVPQRRHHQGRRYHVRVEVAVAGGDLVVSTNDDAQEALLACIDTAFASAQRLVTEYASRRRRELRGDNASVRGLEP